MDVLKLRTALLEAENGLEEIIDEFQSLSRKKNRLESVISSLKTLLTESDLGSAIPFVAPEASITKGGEPEANESKAPNWVLAKAVLLRAGRTMTIPQITTALEAEGHSVNGDGMRVALLRKPEVFSNPAYGKYGLKAWNSQSTVDDTAIEEIEASAA